MLVCVCKLPGGGKVPEFHMQAFIPCCYPWKLSFTNRE